MKHTSRVKDFMTHQPHTIGFDIEAKKAAQVMLDLDVRHLPVRKGGKLVGIVSDRDLRLARSFRGPGELTVDDVMTMDPYVVSPEAPLDEVVAHMAAQKIGSAIVEDSEGKLVGIFTDTDALRVLAGVLRREGGRGAA